MKAKAKTKSSLGARLKAKLSPKPKGSVDTFILLDRSGSMQGKWQETLSSINTYVDELRGADATVTLAAFDHNMGLKFEVIRDAVKPKAWSEVTKADAAPRGFTPLYDAIGSMVQLADKRDPKRAVIAVMTDGFENASTEYSREAAKRVLDKCRAKGWAVVFLGAEFDAFNQAASVGTMAGHTINASAAGLRSTMAFMAQNTRDYAGTGAAATMEWSEKARAAAVPKTDKKAA